MLLLFFKFKGELTWKMQDGLKTEKMCNHFHLQASFGGFVAVYTREVLFWLRIGVPQGAAMLVSSLPVKSRKSWLVTYLPHLLALFMSSLT